MLINITEETNKLKKLLKEQYENKNNIIENNEKEYNKYIKSSNNYQRYWLEEWEFNKKEKGNKNNIKLYTHKLVDYPAMYVPQLVRKLIKEYTEEKDTILDIFSGSGTTVTEAKILNRNAIGIDLNPYAYLISKVKTTIIEKEILEKSYENFLNTYFDKEVKLIKEKEFNIYEEEIKKEFENIEYWFHPFIIKIFIKIKYTIKEFNKKEKLSEIQKENLTNLYKIIFSSIIRKYSYTNTSGFKIHRDKNKVQKYNKEFKNINEVEEIVINELIKNAIEIILSINSLNIKIKENSNFQKINTINILGDSKQIISKKEKYFKKRKIDLILTSPPYGDSKTTVAYGQFSKFQSFWLELFENNKIQNIDNILLGGTTKNIDINDNIIYRSQTLFQAITTLKTILNIEKENTKIQSNIKRIKDVISFYIDLEKTIENASKLLEKNKYFILVTGSRNVKGIQLNTDMIISELAENYSFELKSIFYRNIPNKRIPHKVSSTNIKGEITRTMNKESIIILKKL